MSKQDIHNTRELAGRLTFIIGLSLLVIKFIAWYVTGSSAIYSDALESIVNVITAITGWISIRISSRPADKEHPYGHGKVEYFSAGFEGFLIAIAGSLIVYEGVTALIYGGTIQELSIGLALIACTALINGVLSIYLIQTGKKTRSATLIASGYHVGSDAITSIGVFIGLIIVKLTDTFWVDPIIALLVAFHIIMQGAKLIKAAVMRLMDSADEAALTSISESIIQNRKDEWIAPHRLRAWRSGAQLFVDFHMIMPWYLSLKDTHDTEHFIKSSLSVQLNEPIELIIHTEPCFPEACRYCRMKECAYRTSEQEVDSIWDKDILMSLPDMPKPV